MTSIKYCLLLHHQEVNKTTDYYSHNCFPSQAMNQELPKYKSQSYYCWIQRKWLASLFKADCHSLKGKITAYTNTNFIVTHAYPCKENKRKNTEYTIRITKYTLNFKKLHFLHSHLMISMATCNVRATNPARSCQSSQNIVNEAIHAFFTKTTCGQLEFCSFNSQPKLQATLALAVGVAYLNFKLSWYKIHKNSLICTGSSNFTI